MSWLERPRGTSERREDLLELKRAYREVLLREHLGAYVRVAAVAIGVINCGFIWLDHYAFPEQFGEFLWARMGVNAVLLWSYLHLSRTHPIAGQWSVCFSTGAMLLFVIHGTHAPTSGYYVGLVLFLMGSPVLLPLREKDDFDL